MEKLIFLVYEIDYAIMNETSVCSLKSNNNTNSI